MSDVAPTRVVNRRTDAFDIYIGRPSKWGNVFSHQPGTLAMFKVNTREEAIAAYEEWILKQPELLAALPELRGKVLGCWCRPRACHGDVLARLADGLPKIEHGKIEPDDRQRQLVLL